MCVRSSDPQSFPLFYHNLSNNISVNMHAILDSGNFLNLIQICFYLLWELFLYVQAISEPLVTDKIRIYYIIS